VAAKHSDSANILIDLATDGKSIRRVYVTAMKTEFGDTTTKSTARFPVSDLGNGNEWDSWTAAAFLTR